MSEEMKLLPCYKCGGIAIHSYYDKYPKGLEPLIIDGKIIREGKVWHFVKCEKCKEQRTSLHPKCSVEAIKEWNALPRSLTWTTEPPKLNG